MEKDKKQTQTMQFATQMGGFNIVIPELIKQLGATTACVYSELCAMYERLLATEMIEKDGTFFYQSKRIEEKLGFSHDTVNRAIKKLEECGLIESVRKGDKGMCHYKMTFQMSENQTTGCTKFRQADVRKSDNLIYNKNINDKDIYDKDSNIVNDSSKSFDILPFSKGKVSSLEDYIERVLPDYVRNVYAFEFNEHELKLIEYFITKFLKDRRFYLDDEYYPTQKELTKNLETWEILREHGLFARKCFDDAIDQYFELKTNDRMYLSHILAPNMIMGMLTYSEESEQALDYLKENCYQFMCV